MELENIVANTVYLKAREGGGGKRKGKSKKWKQILRFPHISQCLSMKNEIQLNYKYIIDQQPIGRELFREFCKTKSLLSRIIDFLDAVNEYDITPDEKRLAKAEEVYEKYLCSESEQYISQVNGNQVSAIKEAMGQKTPRKELFLACSEEYIRKQSDIVTRVKCCSIKGLMLSDS